MVLLVRETWIRKFYECTWVTVLTKPVTVDRASPLTPQPSTLNPQPSTLYPQPPTLKPQPPTLNPAP